MSIQKFMIKYISLNDYKKKRKYKTLSKAQIDYLNYYCKKNDKNELMILEHLGRLDIRRKPKTQYAIYYSILDAINKGIHVSPLLFEIDDSFFLAYLDRLVSLDLLILVVKDHPEYSESYVVTEKTAKFVNENRDRGKKLFQELFENTIAKTVAEIVKTQISG